ncbi:hypothetical protein I6A60_24610 [Frankia sp. AgB1.9]|uniref:hypothetical protein n=1 Tax=unclassified Frankia TaxID=2632575 RepID=UPI001933C28D|nr:MULTISPECIES: hypothetical protein [unclassified Frankia]MBL7490830.1 hypothetical protein [Frankia sp. AgW1.1]MBL7551023.1 hypothetical protein [Frankia sp. AgB1.9]MBL7621196.1 hypothetical protein [Frankia sp. AgB1.8]
MSFAPLAAVGTLVFTFVNFLTYIRARQWNGVLTQAIAWVAGVGAIMLAARTDFASNVSFGDSSLGNMDIATQIFLGLIATSILSTVNEFKKAFDNSDSAKKDPLLTARGPGSDTAGPAGSPSSVQPPPATPAPASTPKPPAP